MATVKMISKYNFNALSMDGCNLHKLKVYWELRATGYRLVRIDSGYYWSYLGSDKRGRMKCDDEFGAPVHLGGAVRKMAGRGSLAKVTNKGKSPKACTGGTTHHSYKRGISGNF
ncbi:hypothetical protein DPEC_G00263020 [Dallia pectoralis]|uniref:Uncharacterized protein n=1 Tax=Dallia pectoralis TaxID=75939 RepID=A0ACC2FRY2_DALPE|nr:hypothetical protein DPEC_G00263020 [Dallia pectoralis]